MQGWQTRAQPCFFTGILVDWMVTMGLLENLLLAVGLAMDAFAVSLCMGATGRVNSERGRFRLAASFGIFQA
ncbi:MAG: hypothetical protein ACYCZF_12665, partial [Anaerolineae bacterium]